MTWVRHALSKCKNRIIRYRDLMVASRFNYNPADYPNSFTSKYSSDIPDSNADDIKKVIYTFWTGYNEMSDNRKRGIESLKKTCGVDVRLITPENLSNYIKDDDPLPECFQYLSAVHKSDYLRTYFMHHYGGGYSDIKSHVESWCSSFDRFEKSDKYICGYREVASWAVATPEDAETHQALVKNWAALIGNCSYICRPHTKFTDEWYHETKARVLAKSDLLRAHPATDPYGKNPDYPIPWFHILGDVFHPLCLKYSKKIMIDDSLIPTLSNYR